jgi:hypothetical protein
MTNATTSDGTEAQKAHAKSLGFKYVDAARCLKKIVEPGYRHKESPCPFELRLDHPRLWRTSTGELFATADPYNLDLEDLEGLREISRELRLDVRLHGSSVYNPGHTFTILITRKGSSVTW